MRFSLLSKNQNNLEILTLHIFELFLFYPVQDLFRQLLVLILKNNLILETKQKQTYLKFSVKLVKFKWSMKFLWFLRHIQQIQNVSQKWPYKFMCGPSLQIILSPSCENLICFSSHPK